MSWFRRRREAYEPPQITPASVQAAQFTSRGLPGRRGYDEDEIDAFLDAVCDELEALRAERDAARAELDAIYAGYHQPAPAPPVPARPRSLPDMYADLARATGAPPQETSIGDEIAGEIEAMRERADSVMWRAGAEESHRAFCMRNGLDYAPIEWTAPIGGRM